MRETIAALILSIAAEVGIPPEFALAIALTENAALNPMAVNSNQNGSRDNGIMQLNNRYFGHIEWESPEANIRAGCLLLLELINTPGMSTYWGVALSYNAGTRWLLRSERPPESSIDYAYKVIEKWNSLTHGKTKALIK